MRLFMCYLLLLACLARGLAGTRQATSAKLEGVPDSAIAATVEAALGEPNMHLSEQQGLPEDLERRAGMALAALGASPKATAVRTLALELRVGPGALDALQSPNLAGVTTLELRLEGDPLVLSELARASFAPTLQSLEVYRPMEPELVSLLLTAMPSLERLLLREEAAAGSVAMARVLAKVAPARLVDLRMSTCTPEMAAADRNALFQILAGLPSLRSLATGNVDLACAAALLDSGLAGRLDNLYAPVTGREAAVRLGREAPQLGISDGFSSPEVKAGWLSARASRRMKDGVVPGEVWIGSDRDVPMLTGVQEIKGKLFIFGDVHDLDALQKLRQVYDLDISGTELVGLEDLGALERIDHWLTIRNNQQLRSTAGLRSLREVGALIQIPSCTQGNPRLELISFPALERVGGPLNFSTEPGQYYKRTTWHTDQPCGESFVTSVQILPFPRLVSAGVRNFPEDDSLVDQRPDLFPALKDRGEAAESSPR